MGWFDEDDSDEEEEVTAAGSANADEEEDPLDAYMKSLQPDTPSKPRAERLDVDNADEATSHWKERAVCIAAEQKQEEERVASSQASTAAQEALDSTFHKAATSTNTNVSIQLTPVRHDEMKYRPFQRVLLRQVDATEKGSASDAANAWRTQHDVTCTPTNVDPITSFAAIQQALLESSSNASINAIKITNQITKSGFATPTPVQAQTLAVALAGHDALVTASTGSGKTMAYVWPMLYHIQYNSTGTTNNQGGGPKGLILVPTREIAQQVHKHVKAAMTTTPLHNKSIAITGGVNRYQLVQDLKRHPVQVVVATPGRLLDVLSIKKNGLSLQYVTFLVLDECDKMLDMGFEDQVQQLLTNVRPDRQSLLLSATLGRKIERVANQWLSRHNSIRYVVVDVTVLFCCDVQCAI
jgi:CRISPR/Cas system-associated endonuclease/helicase Cas3